METVWKYSLETEAQRIIHCAYQISTGFYKINNFSISFNLQGKHSANEVIFPNLVYSNIPDFWKTIKSLHYITKNIRTKDIKLIDNVQALLKSTKLHRIDYSETKKRWNNAQKDIMQEIYHLIPEKENFINKITIYPTLFGSSATINWPKKWPADIIIYLRKDQDIYAITEMILTVLTRKDVFSLNGLWTESELLVDWLLTYSSLAGVLKKYQKGTNFVATLKSTREKQYRQTKTATDYINKRLGIISQQKRLYIKNQKLYIDKQIITSLSVKEDKLLRLFIHSYNRIISYDDISTLIFPDEEHFSLWAIAKTIERLRSKIEMYGIPGSSIQSIRGQGYLLKN